jgi:uncharacterized protein GlcG (DUF336 family)
MIPFSILVFFFDRAARIGYPVICRRSFIRVQRHRPRGGIMAGKTMRTIGRLAAFGGLAACLAAPAGAEHEGSYTQRHLTPETALKAAQAALKKCRDEGYQVAVAVVDRSGLAQVMLRDRFAGPHTPNTAIGKAWTAVSFRSNTSDLVGLSQPGSSASGMRELPNVVVLSGGVIVEAGGNIVAGIGVSGAPVDKDEVCAKAGIGAIRESLEL